MNYLLSLLAFFTASASAIAPDIPNIPYGCVGEGTLGGRRATAGGPFTTQANMTIQMCQNQNFCTGFQFAELEDGYNRAMYVFNFAHQNSRESMGDEISSFSSSPLHIGFCGNFISNNHDSGPFQALCKGFTYAGT
ncbi:hypothetical protein M422DRAFT_785637 [Sphaerobolus stellatus SS14]|uniref:Uncharacterized protein n=1 Tax=Sphaerobolus stellatus (strain SS14) TaxID=990650 RepID=A0A0C9UIT2_SPHS4|nr:hypothetical protein M422DRAFT_785637 [Sphaerobolus stellatus SS14]